MSGDIERPAEQKTTPGWASDVLAETLQRLEIPFIALNPGASYRGLHDSLVNHLGNRRPQMLLCLHEEHAVAIAHGWAKVRGTPIGVLLHSNVGLMHATMPIFNMWCDRLPVILLGATGPLAADKRRAWIDWIHTAVDQAALIRNYTKWDDQPASLPAAVESLLRANIICQTAPRGPVYVCFDAGLQEAAITVAPALADISRYRPPPAVQPAQSLVEEIAELLMQAERPLIFAGRCSRGEDAWARRIALVEQCDGLVLSDIRIAGAFPTAHCLHGPPARSFPTKETLALIRSADVILSLDWVDLAGPLRAAWGDAPVGAKIIHASADQHAHRGWTMEYQALPPIDFFLICEADAAVERLVGAMQRRGARSRPAWVGTRRGGITRPVRGDGPLTTADLAASLAEATRGQAVTLITSPSGWNEALWPIEHPLDYLGRDGGGGIGTAPGIAVGAALALQGTGRLPVSIHGDGNFLMGVMAIWTAVHYRIPLLIVVANNRSYFNDETHQGIVAQQRGRPVENKWIGQRISDPDANIAMLAAAQGAVGFGPVADRPALDEAMRAAVAAVRAGGVAVVDCLLANDERPIPPRGGGP
jgi:thiamine pyrophosphate-dependent acetolactate synthase large subunit-like protein